LSAHHFGLVQIVEAKVIGQARLILSEIPRRCVDDTGPLGDAIVIPLIILPDGLKPRQIKGDGLDVELVRVNPVSDSVNVSDAAGARQYVFRWLLKDCGTSAKRGGALGSICGLGRRSIGRSFVQQETTYFSRRSTGKTNRQRYSPGSAAQHRVDDLLAFYEFTMKAVRLLMTKLKSGIRYGQKTPPKTFALNHTAIHFPDSSAELHYFLFQRGDLRLEK
jgi:hypothetical protein